MNRARRIRLITAVLGASLLVTQVASVAAAPPGGSSRSVAVSAAGQQGLGTFIISAGESIPLDVTVSNNGKQTLNNVRLLVGRDDDPTTAANGDANPPAALPSGVTAVADGCAAGSVLTCEIGSLRSKQAATIRVTFVLAEGAPASVVGTKATVKVAEGGNDAGGNLDSFSIEGGLTVVPFSCARVAVFRPSGTSKEVATCAVTDARNALGQSARVVLPRADVTTMDLKVNAGVACPNVPGVKCVGNEIEADVTGDTNKDVLPWSSQVKLAGQNVNLNKIVVRHIDDDGKVTTFSLKDNACSAAKKTYCGTASVSGGILTVEFRTPGNGKIRILG